MKHGGRDRRSVTRKCRQKVVGFGSFVLIGSLIGWFMLLIVYLLPVEPMEKNVRIALEELSDLGPSPMLFEDNAATQLDIYTDTIMLNEAIYAGNESILERVAAVYRYDYEDRTPFQSLLAYLSGESGVSKIEYARYWHGYLVFLKPLLLIGTYNNIKCLNLFIQIFLISVIALEMTKRKLTHYIGCLILGVYALMPIAVVLCLQYSTILNITLIACVILLKFYEWFKDHNVISYFYVSIGMVVCYFDFLTYPLVSLGFVLLMHSILEKSNGSIKRCFCDTLSRMFYWSFGYVGLWGLKWVYASIFMQENIIKEGILQMLYRASTGASEIGVMEEISRTQTIMLNIRTIASPSMIIALSVFACVIVAVYIGKRKISLNIPIMIVQIAIAIMPVIWVAVTANHAYIHYWMVYRVFAISVFSITCMMTSLVWEGNS